MRLVEAEIRDIGHAKQALRVWSRVEVRIVERVLGQVGTAVWLNIGPTVRRPVLESLWRRLRGRRTP